MAKFMLLIIMFCCVTATFNKAQAGGEVVPSDCVTLEETILEIEQYQIKNPPPKGVVVHVRAERISPNAKVLRDNVWLWVSGMKYGLGYYFKEGCRVAIIARSKSWMEYLLRREIKANQADSY